MRIKESRKERRPVSETTKDLACFPAKVPTEWFTETSRRRKKRFFREKLQQWSGRRWPSRFRGRSGATFGGWRFLAGSFSRRLPRRCHTPPNTTSTQTCAIYSVNKFAIHRSFCSRWFFYGLSFCCLFKVCRIHWMWSPISPSWLSELWALCFVSTVASSELGNYGGTCNSKCCVDC